MENIFLPASLLLRLFSLLLRSLISFWPTGDLGSGVSGSMGDVDNGGPTSSANPGEVGAGELELALLSLPVSVLKEGLGLDLTAEPRPLLELVDLFAPVTWLALRPPRDIPRPLRDVPEGPGVLLALGITRDVEALLPVPSNVKSM